MPGSVIIKLSMVVYYVSQSLGCSLGKVSIYTEVSCDVVVGHMCDRLMQFGEVSVCLEA